MWLLTSQDVKELASCNHSKADARIVLNASKANNPVVVVASDTDILIALTCGLSCCKTVQEWIMKISSEMYVSILGYFGNDICKDLMVYNNITGCDKTSNSFGIGKIKPSK